jgi:hypothetical protein
MGTSILATLSRGRILRFQQTRVVHLTRNVEMDGNRSLVAVNDVEYHGAVHPLRGSLGTSVGSKQLRGGTDAAEKSMQWNAVGQSDRYDLNSDSDREVAKGKSYDSQTESDGETGRPTSSNTWGGEADIFKQRTASSTNSGKASNSADKTRDSSTSGSKSKKSDDRDDAIVIHVCDEARKVNKDFKCSKRLLLTEMKYFKTYLSGTSVYDDIDISVHCDVHIFDWLMKYIKAFDAGERGPELDTKSVVSILISSDFLEMGTLVTDCLRYVHDNINSIVKMPIDLNCINAKLLSRLSKMFSTDQLDLVVDKRNKLLDKLWMKKLEAMLEDSKKAIKACNFCNKLFSGGFWDILECSKAQPFIDFHGNVIARHVAMDDKLWNMRTYIKGLRSKQGLTWNKVYWRIWGLTHGMTCKLSDIFYPFAEANHSLYHPQAPLFSPGENTGTYPCCKTIAFRFDTSVRKSGCQARPYVARTNSASDEALLQTFNAREDLIALQFVSDEPSFGYQLDYKLGLISQKESVPVESEDVPSVEPKHPNDKSGIDGGKKDRRPSTASNVSGRRRSNSKEKKDDEIVPLKTDDFIDAENNKSKGAERVATIPLRKWRRHSSLHIQSDDQPPTPEHYKLNPQRRRMWKIDLQREEDVRRMELLMQQLSQSRTEEKNAHYLGV